MSSFEIPEPIVKLELSGTNYGRWALITSVTLRACGLWKHITGESACPPAPVPPPRPPATAAKVTDAANKSYQSALDAYRQWDANDSRAILILVQSVEADDIVHLELQTAQQMWAHLQRRYQPVVDAVHYSVLQQLQTLKQDDDTVEDFYNRFMPLWCKLQHLVPLPNVCRGCACCVKHRQHNHKSCLYELLIRLRPEFEPAKVRLLSSSLPSVIEARNTLLVEEILLRSTAPVVTTAEKKNKKNKKRTGSRTNLRSSEPSEGSSSLLSQNKVAWMVNRFQGLTHHGSSGSTNLPHSRNFRQLS